MYGFCMNIDTVDKHQFFTNNEVSLSINLH